MHSVSKNNIEIIKSRCQEKDFRDNWNRKGSYWEYDRNALKHFYDVRHVKFISVQHLLPVQIASCWVSKYLDF